MNRRSFLKSLIAAAGGLAVAPYAKLIPAPVLEEAREAMPAGLFDLAEADKILREILDPIIRKMFREETVLYKFFGEDKNEMQTTPQVHGNEPAPRRLRGVPVNVAQASGKELVCEWRNPQTRRRYSIPVGRR